MKRILLVIALLLSSILTAEIQIDEGINEFRIYERGATRNLYFSVEKNKVLVGNQYTNTPLNIYGATTFGKDDTGYDFKLFGASSGSYVLWDESADHFIVESAGLKVNDDGELIFGDADAGDVSMGWNGTYMELAPKTGFWSDCPHLAYPDVSLSFSYFEDFIGQTTLPVATGSAGGWNATGDATYDVKAAAGSIGGQIQLTPETGSNNEVYFALGTLATETYIEYVKSSSDKSWVEFRIAYTSITNAASIFIGLAEEGAAVADFIHDDGNDFADKDLVGFVIWEGDPNAIDCTHQKSGGVLVDAGLSGVPVAGTFLTLGLYFDGVETVTWYHNGTAVQTADLDTTTFPTGEELSPIIAIKNGATDGTIEIDWIKIIAER